MSDQTQDQVVPEIKIANLEPMRVASFYAFGPTPEIEAWKKMADWAGPRGWLDSEEHPVFGFNNPEPTEDGPEYGYEVWMKVGAEIRPAGDVRIGDFNGGPYAVARCNVAGDPSRNIPAGWQHLAEWCNANNRNFGYHPALERFITGMDDMDKLILELYCPIIL
jgi:DNA gyrase inhibitor GyrI